MKKLAVALILTLTFKVGAIQYRIIKGTQVWIFTPHELIAACGGDVLTNRCGMETLTFRPMLVQYLKQRGTNLPPDAVGYICESQAYVLSTNSPAH